DLARARCTTAGACAGHRFGTSPEALALGDCRLSGSVVAGNVDRGETIARHRDFIRRPNMITPLLELALEPTVRRHRQYRQLLALGRGWGVIALVAAVAASAGYGGSWNVLFVLLAGFFIIRFAWG